MPAKPIDARAFETSYDAETDVLEISFGTGEPSLSRNVDDRLILDIGMYSKLPTGLQVLDASRLEKGAISSAMRTKVQPIIQQALAERESSLRRMDADALEDLVADAVTA